MTRVVEEVEQNISHYQAQTILRVFDKLWYLPCQEVCPYLHQRPPSVFRGVGRQPLHGTAQTDPEPIAAVPEAKQVAAQGTDAQDTSRCHQDVFYCLVRVLGQHQMRPVPVEGNDLGEVQIAYKFARGPYKESGALFTEIHTLLPEYRTVGVYYDDPKVDDFYVPEVLQEEEDTHQVQYGSWESEDDYDDDARTDNSSRSWDEASFMRDRYCV
ncbi:hypothetical protein E2C01_011123 [Portunus trituberculatus]|uniref:Uncharacterized protein n=1 Tax=Portunus trituberculatus TaxID=210409 RepID=A0A5B7DAF2_PORTR|nr:hypothetical protein [Portunus trituberculatus]